MEIVLTVKNTPVAEFYAGPWGPGKRFIFSDNLLLKSVDGNPAHAGAKAGTHSGLVTTVRIEPPADPKKPVPPEDRFLPEDAELFQYDGTFRLTDVDGVLKQGEVTARGVVISRAGKPVDETGTILEKSVFAITGGTGPYARAHGEFRQNDAQNTRTLDIQM